MPRVRRPLNPNQSQRRLLLIPIKVSAVFARRSRRLKVHAPSTRRPRRPQELTLLGRLTRPLLTSTLYITNKYMHTCNSPPPTPPRARAHAAAAAAAPRIASLAPEAISTPGNGATRL